MKLFKQKKAEFRKLESLPFDVYGKSIVKSSKRIDSVKVGYIVNEICYYMEDVYIRFFANLKISFNKRSVDSWVELTPEEVFMLNNGLTFELHIIEINKVVDGYLQSNISSFKNNMSENDRICCATVGKDYIVPEQLDGALSVYLVGTSNGNKLMQMYSGGMESFISPDNFDDILSSQVNKVECSNLIVDGRLFKCHVRRVNNDKNLQNDNSNNDNVSFI